MELQSLKIELPIYIQVILAQSHFIKTDFHMYLVLMLFINFISYGRYREIIICKLHYFSVDSAHLT
jgi:adenosine/AMP kinase